MTNPKTHYIWASPHAWLNQRRPSYDALLAAYKRLATGDDIQDEFETDMAADGYFDELLDEPCHVDGEVMTVEDYVTCQVCDRPVCSRCSTDDGPHDPDEAVTRHICYTCLDERESDDERE